MFPEFYKYKSIDVKHVAAKHLLQESSGHKFICLINNQYLRFKALCIFKEIYMYFELIRTPMRRPGFEPRIDESSNSSTNHTATGGFNIQV